MLKTGDVVCTTGRGLLARTIRRVTKGEATHVGIIVIFGGRPFIVEMLSKGVTFSSLNRYLKCNRLEIIEVNRPLKMNQSRRAALLKKVAESLHEEVKYSFRGLLSYVFKRVKENPERFICSIYVANMLEVEGFEELTSSDLAPRDFQLDHAILEMECVHEFL